MSLETPGKIRSLQRKLYCKAKAEPAFRFYLLYDCREDILRHAHALARDNAGAPGVDGVSFEQIDASGVEAWLAGLREDLVAKTYRPDPVRPATIPKPGGGERPLGARAASAYSESCGSWASIRYRVAQSGNLKQLDEKFM
jgi:RNA-directed DNA polymerase